MLNLMRKIQNIQKSSLFKFSRSILDNLTASITHALRETSVAKMNVNEAQWPILYYFFVAISSDFTDFGKLGLVFMDK